MPVAHGTRQRIRLVAAALGVLASLAAIFAVVVPRDDKTFPSSFLWWLGVIPAYLAAYVALEKFGEWSLGLHFWKRMSGWVRVLFLAAIISAMFAAAVVVAHLLAVS